MKRPKLFTRYVSPFGSPATMPREQAETLLAEDAKLYAELAELGLLNERLRRIGKPRLDDNVFRLRDLPTWRDGTGLDVIRALVEDASRCAAVDGEVYVVACRDGKTAMFPHRLVIDGDDVRWVTGPHAAAKVMVR